MKKDNGKWKLRIDFTNINKACTRQPYPLPAAKLGAENLHKYQLKCFLYAYKGYHQIPMAEKDEEKTAFFTREGVFCYRRLPFGLKNAGATYQRLIDKVFGSQIGRNMEVDADDMNPLSPKQIPLEKRREGPPFHENPKKLYEWKDGLVDNRSKRSLPKNERMLRVTANNGYTNQR
ncbi:reverse transcriptase domain-containing protein [Tanacetum coccineum]